MVMVRKQIERARNIFFGAVHREFSTLPTEFRKFIRSNNYGYRLFYERPTERTIQKNLVFSKLKLIIQKTLRNRFQVIDTTNSKRPTYTNFIKYTYSKMRTSRPTRYIYTRIVKAQISAMNA